MQTLFYFIGDNAFALREERHAWARQFSEKHGPENLLLVDAPDARYRSLLDLVSSAPFIASKRLVIVRGTPSLTKEEVETLPSLMHPDCVLLIEDAHPDRRLASVKALLKTATVREFSLLNESALRLWMQDFAQQCGSELSPGAARKLIDMVGEDQDVLAQELRKVCVFASGRLIEQKDIELLAVPSGEQEIWNLTKLLAQGHPGEILQFAGRLIARGEDPYALWNILLWTLRHLVTITAAVEAGEAQPASITSTYKIPFPTVRTLLPLASRLRGHRVRDLLYWATEADVQLKTGGFRATRDAPEEIHTLIDRFLLHCADLKSLQSA